MRIFVCLTMGTLLLAGSGVVVGEKPSNGDQLMFRVRICKGDPLGSREQGTLKVLCEPILVTTENREFSLHVGDEIPIQITPDKVEFAKVGMSLKGLPGVIKDEALRLDLQATNTTVDEQSDDRLILRSESTRTISKVKIGEVVKVRFGKPTGDPGLQTWAEMKLEKVTPSQE